MKNQNIILVVDDQIDVCESLQEILEIAEYEVDITTSGKEALDMIKTRQYSLVLADVVMPKFDGIDLLIRAKEWDKSLTFMMISGKATIEQTIESLRLGASNFIRKPFHPDEVVNLVNSTIIKQGIRKEESESREKTYKLLSKSHFEMIIPSTFSDIRLAIQMILTEVTARGYEDKHDTLAVALDEILTNALIHGSWEDKKPDDLTSRELDKKISIKFTIVPDSIKVVIKDRGKGFDTSYLPDPTDPENIFNSSGRGIFITKNFADSLTYNKKGNQATLIKTLSIKDPV